MQKALLSNILHNTRKKVLCGSLFLCFVFFFFSYAEMRADAATLRKDSGSLVYLFAVPEGGWSSCKVHVIYTEEYYKSTASQRNTFTERGKYFTGKYEYATTCPRLSTGAAVIKDSSGTVYKTYTSWTKVDGIYPGDVDTFGSYENYGQFTLSFQTQYTGQINYTVSCSGATPGNYVKNVSMRLNTN